MQRRRESVLVIGAGPAGLTASLRLRKAGFRVTLISEEPVFGQRQIHDGDADSLPPILLGADHATMALLAELGTARQVHFSSRLHYEFYSPRKPITRLRRPFGPASLRAILTLATFPALSLKDRRRFLSFLERTWEADPPLDLDLDSRPAAQWLDDIGQSEEARQIVWDPLSRFLLGDTLSLVSARLFADTLTRCFLSDARSARLALPLAGLPQLLIEPALAYLSRGNVTVHASVPVKFLRFDQKHVTEVHLDDGRSLRADWYVLAIPHERVSALLPDRILSRYAYFQQIGQLQDLSAITVHLWLADSPKAPRLVLLADHTFHWLVSRRATHKGKTLPLISLVATGSKPPREQPDGTLVQTAHRLVEQAFGLKTSPKVVRSDVVRTSRALLSVKPGTAALRPLQQSPVSNLFLAGAWTDTGLPGSVESAIRSGNICADAIAAQRIE